MPGRYELIAATESDEISGIIGAAEKKFGAQSFKTGEIFPGDSVPVLTASAKSDSMAVNIFVWGFQNFSNDGLIINARSESVTEKPTFKESFAERRCVVPTTGFFEWKPNPSGRKTRYKFNLPAAAEVYCAAIWKVQDGKPRFVLLTADANESVAEVHDRMPIIIDRPLLKEWLNSPESAMEIMREPTPILAGRTV